MALPVEASWQHVEDWHTAGEPFRIVQHLPAGTLTPGLTVAEQRLHILQQSKSEPLHPLDLLRQSLCLEPRGHADMYGCFITPPNDEGACFGAMFWHKDGFSTACGHGTIALGYWAVAHSLVENPGNGTVDVVVDVPSGRVVARATFQDSQVQHVDFVNVASYKSGPSLTTTALRVASRSVDANVTLTPAYGGAAFVCCDVEHLVAFGDTSIKRENSQFFVYLQRKIMSYLRQQTTLQLPEIFGVCFFEHVSDSTEAITQRNLNVFADGQIDRSPCGSATCARLAMLLAEGKVSKEKKLISESIIGTRFEAFIDETLEGPGDFLACIPRVRGQARLVGRSEFLIDPIDPIYPGFVLR